VAPSSVLDNALRLRQISCQAALGDLGLLPEPKRILVVEDDDSAREALALILESEGYEAPSARNGREAIERLADQPHLILLDLIMPEMDGWEFLARKKSTAAAGIPVFVLSASDPRGLDVLKYFQKPINVDTLLDAIRGIFQRPHAI
jgi:CheY-like chemotaxis protein